MKAARTDTTAKPLRKYAEQLGFGVVVLNAVIDSLLVWGQKIYAVDWKTPGGTLTDAQVKLVAKGIPIHFISTPEQLDQLKAEAMR